jgi:hypothetical protein
MLGYLKTQNKINKNTSQILPVTYPCSGRRPPLLRRPAPAAVHHCSSDLLRPLSTSILAGSRSAGVNPEPSPLSSMAELLLAMPEFGKQLDAFSCQIVGAERRYSRPRPPDPGPGAGAPAASFGQEKVARRRWSCEHG